MGVSLSGCHPSVNVTPDGPRLLEAVDLAPDVAPGPTARLTMGAVTLPVEIKQKITPDLIELRLVAHHEPIDLEGYRSSPHEFGVVFAEGEHYNPPIPLLRFPMTVGESWNWSGFMTATAVERPATAEIDSSIGKVTMADGPQTAVRVDVRLHMPAFGDSGAGRRALVFWFVKGRGLVRREFGSESVREPTVSQP